MEADYLGHCWTVHFHVRWVELPAFPVPRPHILSIRKTIPTAHRPMLLHPRLLRLRRLFILQLGVVLKSSFRILNGMTLSFPHNFPISLGLGGASTGLRFVLGCISPPNLEAQILNPESRPLCILTSLGQSGGLGGEDFTKYPSICGFCSPAARGGVLVDP